MKGQKPERPTFAEIMEQAGPETLNFQTLCYAVAWLMLVASVCYGVYRMF
jgi:hypothetical protein